MFPLFVVAQVSGEAQFSRWLMLGGALFVLAIGLAVVVAARLGRRRELERRTAVRQEIASILARDTGDGESSNTTITGRVSIDPPDEEATRRSPMSAYMPDVRSRDTFIDLPSDDPVIDLADETVDLTGQRREVRPAPDSRD